MFVLVCGRTRHEIGEWSQAGVDRQAEILKASAERSVSLPSVKQEETPAQLG